MTHLLDTNTCVVYLRQAAGAAHIATKLSAAPAGSVVLCSVVVAELLYGAYRSAQMAKTLGEVKAFASGFASLVFDDATADDYGRIRAHLANQGTPIGPNDLMIAAIARANGLNLVTHNTAEFSRVPGLNLEDWQTP